MERTQICGVVLDREIAKIARVIAASESLSRSAFMRQLLINELRTRGVLPSNHQSYAFPEDFEGKIKAEND